jgi:hypothetical protein
MKMKLNVLTVISSMIMLLYSLLSLFRAVEWRRRGGGRAFMEHGILVLDERERERDAAV